MPLKLLEAKQGQYQPFFRQIFFEDIKDRVPVLAEEQFVALADMQFRAMETGYKQNWPSARTYLVSFERQNVGKLVLHTQSDTIRIIDLILQKASRGQGIGKSVLDTLWREASRGNQELRLSVAKGNPAVNLYLREGFKVDWEDQTQIEMHKSALDN